MSLKSIKDNYTKMLGVFKEVGVKIDESQKQVLDNFMLDIENSMNKTRDDAIRATKRIVEDKMEKDYENVFESIRKHTEEMNEKAGMVQKRIYQINESKKIAEAVDRYLDMYVEEILPKKAIVDYGRMEKLERIHESLKEMLQVNDMALENKKIELEGKLVKESKDLREKCQCFEKRINEDETKMKELQSKIDEAEAREFVANKVKDLPVAESEKVCCRTKGMTKAQLEQDFQKILEGVRQEIDDEKNAYQEEKNLEEAIADIMNEKAAETADNENFSNTDAEGTDVDADVNADQSGWEEEEDSGIQTINESVMLNWIDTLNRIAP